MKKEKQANPNIFLSLENLLKYEWFGKLVNFSASKQKSNSILSGRFASKLRGRGLDFEESRPYVIGDDIRNIDWNVTAKTGKTHTKIFTEEKEKPAFIFVDQSPTMGFGSQLKTKSVIAGELAALSAFKIFKSGDRIGGLVYKGNDYDMITPKRNRENILHFLKMIVNANHSIYKHENVDYTSSLKIIMSKLHQIITHDFFVIIISDFIRYDPDVLKYISELSNHNDLLLIKVFDPMERDFPEDKIVVTNNVQQINIDGKNKKLNNKIKTDYNTNYNSFKYELDKYEIPIFQINTIDPIGDQLVEIFNSYKV